MQVVLPAVQSSRAKITVFQGPLANQHRRSVPSPDAWSRPDIPLYAMAMLPKNPRDGIAEQPACAAGEDSWKTKGQLVAYVGDVVGTAPPRKSAANSGASGFTGETSLRTEQALWRRVALGSKIAPIFFNTMEDSGALPLKSTAAKMDMGDEIRLR